MKKRFFSWIILFLFSVCANPEGYAQSGIDNTLFQIEGQILGKDTGLISIEYTDALNLPHYDSVRLTQGRFTYRCHKRTAAEMVIKTEQHFRFNRIAFYISESG